MIYPYDYPAVGGFNVLISVYGVDGTVAVAHGGIEIGQGINTKVSIEIRKLLKIYGYYKKIL